MILEDLEFIIDPSEYILVVNQDNVGLFFGKWYQCKLSKYRVIDIYPDWIENKNLSVLNIRIFYESKSKRKSDIDY